MLVSVIIPTYNRKSYLIGALSALARQTIPRDQFEVIVVDDGSKENVAEITRMQFPYYLRYFWQENQGDAAARNFGALQSEADLLVFIDDDIFVDKDYLTAMVDAHSDNHRLIVMGTTILWVDRSGSVFQQLAGATESINNYARPSFTTLCSNNMSVRRNDYFKIGMMENLGFSGSSLWCDVDFAYRAYKLGYSFSTSHNAIGYNKDYVKENLHNASLRGYTMAYRAVVLFQKHPDLVEYIPMFLDKIPIKLESDPIGLIFRKLARHPASSRFTVFTMEQIVRIIEKSYPSPNILRPLYRWIIGGYIFRGYRQGLREFGQISNGFYAIHSR
jgi:glycosyltransferase involved in cell wall biosynthesis